MFLACRRACGFCNNSNSDDFVEAAEPTEKGQQEEEEQAFQGHKPADGGGKAQAGEAAASLLVKPFAEGQSASKKAVAQLSGVLQGHPLPQEEPAAALPGQPPADSPAEGSLQESASFSPLGEDSPALKLDVQCAEKPPFAPLEEDLPIFELDLQRMEVAKAKLNGFRERVGAELLEGLPSSAAERSFCSDATMLRYLITCDGSEKKALSMLKETLKWRKKYFAAGCSKACPKCQHDPRSHCFLHMGKDAAGRHVIYSCAGRASNKTVADGMRHMSSELERMFDGNSEPGQIVWIVDFAGFGFSDCNPRMGATAVPMFANHYPERFGQIVLFAMPGFFRAIYAAGMKLLDPVMQRKVVILHSDESRRRYAERYWSCNPVMAEWLQAVANCKGVPGSYPDLALSRQIDDESTRDILERCAALGPAS